MKFELMRHGIKITPENPQDRAYIEDTLGLRKNSDFIKLVACTPAGIPNHIAWLETKRVNPANE